MMKNIFTLYGGLLLIPPQVKAEMERGDLSRAASAEIPAQIPIKTKTQISSLSPRVFFGYFYIINDSTVKAAEVKRIILF